MLVVTIPVRLYIHFVFSRFLFLRVLLHALVSHAPARSRTYQTTVCRRVNWGPLICRAKHRYLLPARQNSQYQKIGVTFDMEPQQIPHIAADVVVHKLPSLPVNIMQSSPVNAHLSIRRAGASSSLSMTCSTVVWSCAFQVSKL